jgi:hypothetical protein
VGLERQGEVDHEEDQLGEVSRGEQRDMFWAQHLVGNDQDGCREPEEILVT